LYYIQFSIIKHFQLSKMESYYQPVLAQIQNDETNAAGRTKVAIQGVEGAFHEIAARYFHTEGGIEIVPADTFDILFSKVLTGEANAAVMAIENTIAGSILRNYNLLNNSKLRIKGEVFLRIKQNLMVLPGTKIEDLDEVHSHPIALQQVEDFFEQYPHIKLIEAHDTALVAKEIRAKGLTKIGAIGSVLAAEIYDMDILAASIETYKKNYTRFLYISPDDIVPNVASDGKGVVPNFDKVSMVFNTSHTVGSLHKALEVLSRNNCNLTKIQSAPIMDKPWEYMFYVDFTLNNYSNYPQAMVELLRVVGEVKVLGEYKSGEYHE
jgi:prephenate dehydratase